MATRSGSETSNRSGASRTDDTARGFDTIVDNTHFAGSDFSFFNREGIRLTGTGVALVAPDSFLPNLRSSKDEGQANFVNPGLYLVNLGVDFDLTPRLKMINNANQLWFDDTSSLRTFVFQNHVANHIGTDLSTGFEYRPLLSNNVVVTCGVSTLIPGEGFRQLYDRLNGTVPPLVAGFLELNLTF